MIKNMCAAEATHLPGAPFCLSSASLDLCDFSGNGIKGQPEAASLQDGTARLKQWRCTAPGSAQYPEPTDTGIPSAADGKNAGRNLNPVRLAAPANRPSQRIRTGHCPPPKPASQKKRQGFVQTMFHVEQAPLPARKVVHSVTVQGKTGERGRPASPAPVTLAPIKNPAATMAALPFTADKWPEYATDKNRGLFSFPKALALSYSYNRSEPDSQTDAPKKHEPARSSQTAAGKAFLSDSLADGRKETGMFHIEQNTRHKNRDKQRSP